MSYKRSKDEKEHLKKLYEETKYWYGAGAYYNERTNRYKKYSCHNEWTKTYCRRITRRKLNKIDNNYHHCSYKKIYDYWWEVT